MTRRAAPALLLAVLPALVLAGCGQDSPGTAGGSTSVVDPQEPVLPDGWRWESYAGVQVGVPGDFGWTTGAQRIGQWCVGGERDEPLRPAVGRPGFSTVVGCPEGDPDPATLVENTGVVVSLESVQEDVPIPTDTGDQSVLVLGDVLVRVIGPADLREQVLATAHEADVDAKGCAMRLPEDVRPGSAPSPAADVTTLEEVTAVAACSYSIPHPGTGTGSGMPLQSSLLLEGRDAAEVVEAIAEAPVGGGPDEPDSCLPEYSYGEEFLVVHVESAQGRSTLHAYYSGCDHNGFDDGTTVRALTREAIRPLIADANAPDGWSGSPGKTEMLQP